MAPQHRSDPTSPITSFGASMPVWVDEEVAALGNGPVGDGQEVRTVLMRLLNRLADRNMREGGGGPFAALVRDPASGEIVTAGVNRVLASGLSSMHAEVTTLSLAQARRGTWDLGSAGAAPLELWVNARPCVMCYGATMWSGVFAPCQASVRSVRWPSRLLHRPCKPSGEAETSRPGLAWCRVSIRAAASRGSAEPPRWDSAIFAVF